MFEYEMNCRECAKDFEGSITISKLKKFEYKRFEALIAELEKNRQRNNDS